MEIGWPLPELHSLYLSKPGSYLSHLFGHEGAGSILSLLKVCLRKMGTLAADVYRVDANPFLSLPLSFSNPFLLLFVLGSPS